MPITQLFPDLYQITLPTPFPVGDVHAYLLMGEPLTLIDTGVRTPDSERLLVIALAEIGVNAADLDQIVLSHSHVDHIGQAQWLQAASGAAVLAHPHTCDKLASLHDYAQNAIIWAGGVLDAAGLQPTQQTFVQAFYGMVPMLAQDVTVNRCLDEGAVLIAGKRRLQVLFCPGHAGDLICFYDPAERLLIGSDHLIKHISSNALLEPPRRGEAERRLALAEYWQSLERLESFEIDTVLSGHGQIITDTRGLLAERRQRRDQRLARIEALLSLEAQDAWSIAQHIFPALAGADVFLAISEVIGHLDLLILQGRVQASAETQPLLYRAI